MAAKQNKYPFGIIGNCNYTALIDDQTRIVWLCWPHFDSSFVFGRLLDENRGGEFSIVPKCERFNSRQSYIENTNVLQTVVETADEIYRVTDFAPRFEHYGRFNKPLTLIRKIEPLKGAPKIKVVCTPRGDYGRKVPNIHFGSNHIHYSEIGGPIRLTTNLPLSYIANERYFVLDGPKYLVLTWGLSFHAPLETTVEDFLIKTVAYWQGWAAQCSIGRFYQKQVLRSALALKLHQYEDTGAIIASATTSLPESPGTPRTWDYRYCWLRDTYYTLNALNRMSRFDEMKKFAQFVENIAESEEGRYAPVYTITGDSLPPEEILGLDGYQNNKPVRIGNAASNQVQNDIYGQILLALLPLYVDERFPGTVQSNSHQLVKKVLQHIERKISEPDASLWEFRNRKEHHCYTYLYHWAGSKAANKIAEKLKDEELFRLSSRLASKARHYIESCYVPDLKVYGATKLDPYMDASLLHLITQGYLIPRSERAQHHLKQIERVLLTPKGHMYRYKREDDFGTPEVAFTICTFWYVEALASVGRLDEAFQIFENLLNHTNHLGLLSEDFDENTQSLWGNFPQTYSHVGLINAAFKLSQSFEFPEFF